MKKIAIYFRKDIANFDGTVYGLFFEGAWVVLRDGVGQVHAWPAQNIIKVEVAFVDAPDGGAA